MFRWHMVGISVAKLIFIKDSFGEMDGKPYLCPSKKLKLLNKRIIDK